MELLANAITEGISADAFLRILNDRIAGPAADGAGLPVHRQQHAQGRLRVRGASQHMERFLFSSPEGIARGNKFYGFTRDKSFKPIGGINHTGLLRISVTQ